MTLRNEQIESLFEFTQTLGVKYYDIQVELVDHLASQIETDMAADHRLSFQEALNNAYTSFGPNGFSFIENQKEEALFIQYKGLWSDEVKQWITLKNLLLLLGIGLAAYFLGTAIDPSWRLHIVVVAFAILLYFQLTKAQAQKKEATKKLMVLEYLESKKWFALMTDAIIINLATGDWFFVPVEIVVGGVLFFFVSRISTHRVHMKMTLQVQNEYPEAFT